MRRESIARAIRPLGWAVALGSLVGLVGTMIRPAREAEGPAGDPDPPGVVTVPAVSAWTTLVGFFHETPPPWPRGNCFHLSPLSVEERKTRGPEADPDDSWFVLNMHAENFKAIVERSGIKAVKVERVGKRACLVVDPRIPNEWLLESPCKGCTPADASGELGAHAHQFREK